MCIRSRLSFLLTALALGSGVGCQTDTTAPTPDPDPNDPAPVVRVDVSPGADTLTALGASRTYRAVATDQNGRTVDAPDVVWSSSDEEVASVDAEGVVTALSNGTAQIVARVAEVDGSAALQVIQMANEITVTPSTATITTMGSVVQFEARALDANGNELEAARFLWQSSDPAVATVDTLGRATGRSTGDVVVTAAAQGVPGHASLDVDQTADRLHFRVEPAGAVAGEAIDPAIQVEVVDAEGHRVLDAAPAITLGFADDPGGARLSGTRTVHAVDGVAVFSGLWIDRAAEGHALQATAEGVGTATSVPFPVAPAAPARLHFLAEPGSGVAGESLPGPVVVGYRDRFGNAVPTAIEPVTIALGANPGAGTLLGGDPRDPVAGSATFDALSLEKAAAGYTLRAEAPGLESAASATFDVAAAVPARLAFVDAPGVVEGQEPFAARVAVLDAFDNVVQNAEGPVSLALDAPPGHPGLEEVPEAAPVDGVATFEGLSLAHPGEDHVLRASSGTLAAASSEPFDVRLTFVQVTVGVGYTCAVTRAGHAYCWGYGPAGQLGTGASGDEAYDVQSTPVPVAGGHRFAAVSAAYTFTCGVALAGHALCWGTNERGAMGTGDEWDSYPEPEPVLASASFATIATFGSTSGYNSHTCALDADGKAYCWGPNSWGQLGDGTETVRTTPTEVQGGLTFTSLDVGASTTCGTTSNGEMYCWGSALGRQGQDLVPARVPGDHEFRQVRLGEGHACARDTLDRAWCWGSNFRGLGDGTTEADSIPRRVTGGFRVAEIAAGERTSCAVTRSGETYCWGENNRGQLGRGTLQHDSIPGAVVGNHTVKAVDIGATHACAVTESHELYCWGLNGVGQLGDGTLLDSSVPVRVRH